MVRCCWAAPSEVHGTQSCAKALFEGSVILPSVRDTFAHVTAILVTSRVGTLGQGFADDLTFQP